MNVRVKPHHQAVSQGCSNMQHAARNRARTCMGRMTISLLQRGRQAMPLRCPMPHGAGATRLLAAG